MIKPLSNKTIYIQFISNSTVEPQKCENVLEALTLVTLCGPISSLGWEIKLCNLVQPHPWDEVFISVVTAIPKSF